jgi:hypothetical protein
MDGINKARPPGIETPTHRAKAIAVRHTHSRPEAKTEFGRGL